MRRYFVITTIAVTVALVLLSCQSRNSEVKVKFINFINSIGGDANAKRFLIVPVDGCDTCIKKVLEFIEEHGSSDSICYILVSADPKNVVPQEIMQLRNMVFDKNLISIREGLIKGLVPAIYYDENLEKPVRLTPDNIDRELKKLEEKLK